jgi:uncharacterized protein (TIGR03437 family)
MLGLRPLANQRIAADDSVLGRFASTAHSGFARGSTYSNLVKAAFQPAYWDSAQVVDEQGNVLDAGTAMLDAKWFTQAEYNFSMFFGVAIQAYEATLVSDDSPMDRFAEGQTTALNNQAVRGMQLFNGRTGCNVCHAGAEFSLATHTGINGNDPLKAGRDTGYFHIGVRPIGEDLGLGGLDGFGKPLAGFLPTDNSLGTANGRFKTPGLRNVEFTGPYFHNGSQATLKQVMEFYNRGGDFPVNPISGPDIRPLALSPEDQTDLVAFMMALTDERVKYERAPFDHPELCVPDGHLPRADGNPAFPMSAADRWVGIPAVGRGGNSVPLQTFEELLAGAGTDGSRAHHMAEACAIEAVTATGFVSANAASFERGILARDSIASVFGTGFATETSVAGLTVTVEDSAGVAKSAPMFFASPGQVNFLVPDGTAAGPATVVVGGGSRRFQSQVLVRAVAPGLFGASGLAAANVVTYGADGSQRAADTLRAAGAGGGLEAVPIDLGGDDQKVFLILYGTGIRHHTGPVMAKIGGVTLQAAYAGPQGTFEGQDQINIELARSLRGTGMVDVILSVDGQTTNPVKILIQ